MAQEPELLAEWSEGLWELGKWPRALLLPKSSALEMPRLDSLARLELLKELETAIWLLVGLHTKLTGLLALTGY